MRRGKDCKVKKAEFAKEENQPLSEQNVNNEGINQNEFNMEIKKTRRDEIAKYSINKGIDGTGFKCDCKNKNKTKIKRQKSVIVATLTVTDI